MSSIESLKAEARELRQKEKAAGRELKHCAALEFVAKRHGYESWRACCALLAEQKTGPALMKRYTHSEWNFALDIPARWNAFPPVLGQNRYEVIRFASREDGGHLVKIFRFPHNPEKSLTEVSEGTQRYLAERGFGNFVSALTTLGSRAAATLDFDKPAKVGTWSCRNYIFFAGTLTFVLAFGTTRKDAVFGLCDRMARSLETGVNPNHQAA